MHSVVYCCRCCSFLLLILVFFFFFFFFQAEDGIRDYKVTGVRRVLFRSQGGLPEIFKLREKPTDINFFKRSLDRKSTRLNSSHLVISYAVFCLKKMKLQSVGEPLVQHHLQRLVVGMGDGVFSEERVEDGYFFFRTTGTPGGFPFSPGGRSPA